MIISLALVLLATASGTLVSYLYDEGASFAARLCAGACTGIAALSLVGFIFASFLGLTPLAILLTVLVVSCLPLLALRNPDRRVIVLEELRATYQNIRQAYLNPDRLPLGYIAFYTIVAAILWQAFQRAMIDVPEGIFTGVLNNFGDLPFHLSVISSFAYGNNFPPDDPTYAGVRFTYPFLTDFASAIFVRCGANLRQSMFIENFVVAIAFVGLLHRWALEILRDRIAAVLTPVLVLLSGGFGWALLWKPVTEKSEQGLADILRSLPVSFTVIPDTTWRWGNAVSTLLIPQRGFLLGLPLAVIVFTQWWLADADAAKEPDTEMGGRGAAAKEGTDAEMGGRGAAAKEGTDAEMGGRGDAAKKSKSEKSKKKSKRSGTTLRVPASPPLRVSSARVPASPHLRVSTSPLQRMVAAGVVAGLLPLVHAHSFVVVMVVGATLALIQQHWRAWVGFFVAASLIALPQMWWSTHNSAVDAGKFFEWHLGWDHGQENAFWFWFKNTGLFIPVTVAALLWRSNGRPLVSRRLLIYLSPFALCFIIPNVLKMAPWIWDNIKVLFYWWLAAAPLVALLLARLWREGGLQRAAAIVLLTCVTLAGALDVAAIVLRSGRYGVFNSDGIKFAELIKQETTPRAMVIHAPVHNHPVFLSGRRSLMGYPGHVWTHGLEFAQRESEIRRVYAGASDAAAILRKYGVNYVVVSPLERNLTTVNEQFFSRFSVVGEVGEYRLYKITQP